VKRRILRILAASDALSVVTSTGGTAASAVEEVVWDRIACSSGAIDRADVAPNSTMVTLAIHLDCADPSGAARYGFATYSHHLSDDGHMNKSVVCLVTDYTVRVGCVRLERGLQGREPGFSYLKPEELAQMPPFVVIGYGVTGSPACGSCW